MQTDHNQLFLGASVCRLLLYFIQNHPEQVDTAFSQVTTNLFCIYYCNHSYIRVFLCPYVSTVFPNQTMFLLPVFYQQFWGCVWLISLLQQAVSDKNRQISMLELEKDALLGQLDELQAHWLPGRRYMCTKSLLCCTANLSFFSECCMVGRFSNYL